MIINFNSLNVKHLLPSTDFEKKIIEFITLWFGKTATVTVQTSGSTGKPKILEVQKERMIHSARKTIKFLHLTSEDTALICLPIDFISGKMMVVRAIESKMKLVAASPSLQPIIDVNQKINFSAMTPLQVENSLNELHWIEKLIIGGAAVSAVLKAKIHQTLASATTHPNYQVFETYGMSETLSHIALKEIYPTPSNYFKTLDGVSIQQDSRGCLVINVPAIHEGELVTNDIVELKGEKEFKYIGRIDNVINSGGAKIFPEELELFVKKNIDKENVFIGLKDEKLGERLTLVIEGVRSEQLVNTINQLPFEKKYHRPKSIHFIENLPRTENGKLNRIEIKNQLKDTQ